MLQAPSVNAKRNKELLLIYGHHAMLERWWGLVENLAHYGNVTMPDLPGFGGMDSFAKIGRHPDIDAFADYLAAFIKLRYRRKKVTIIGISFGFVVATRMLQRYPELVKKVTILVSLVGFMHRDDFVYTSRRRRFYVRATRLFATRPFALTMRYVAFNKPVLRLMYAKLPQSKLRLLEVSPEEFTASLELETKMWQLNDVRTRWLTTSEFLRVDNCDRRVDLEVVHVASQHDHYFDNHIVEQHMKVTFTGYKQFVARSKAHTPSVLADKKATAVFLPQGLRRLLAKPN